MAHRSRVAIALPDPLEAATVAQWLDAKGFEPLTPTVAGFEKHDLLIADADLVVKNGQRRASPVRDARTPTILFHSARNHASGLSSEGQPMYLARPVDRATLVCFVMMALLDRRPERRSARKPVHHTEAYVNGLPVQIVDVSNEGLCLATPRDRSALLPPTFNVRIPLMGVSVAVQRVWGRRASGASTTWYGGTLGQNARAAEQGWRTFVDMVPVAPGSPSAAPGP
jgi:hypothetical protein